MRIFTVNENHTYVYTTLLNIIDKIVQFWSRIWCFSRKSFWWKDNYCFVKIRLKQNTKKDFAIKSLFSVIWSVLEISTLKIFSAWASLVNTVWTTEFVLWGGNPLKGFHLKKGKPPTLTFENLDKGGNPLGVPTQSTNSVVHTVSTSLIKSKYILLPSNNSLLEMSKQNPA